MFRLLSFLTQFLSPLFGPLAMYFFPPLLLLFFYSLKSKRLVWLTIPISAFLDALCFLEALLDDEVRVLLILILPLHIAVIGAVTAITALIKSKAKRQPKKRIFVALVLIICVAALGFIAHKVLSDTSDGCRQFFDRPAFTQLTQIQPEDVVNINAFDRREKNKEHYYKDYHGDKTFFADLEYAGSLLSKPGKELTLVADVATNSYSVRFTHHDEDIFRVEYRDRVFYVKSPQLLADIT